MKKYDKNSLIGLLLIGLILIVFNTFFFPNINEVEEKEPLTNNSITNSTNNLTYENPNPEQIIINNGDSTINEELKLQYGIFALSAIGEDNTKILENDKIRVKISTKGGRITSVILKEYKTSNSLPLELFNADSSEFNLTFLTGKEINTKDLYFKAEHESNSLSMKLFASEEQYIEYLYTIDKDYLINLDINLIGMESIISSNVNYMNLEWQMKTPQTEKSKENQDMYTGIQYQYSADQEVDYLSFTSEEDEEKVTSRLNWVAFKQQFFTSIIIAENGFNKPTFLTSKKNKNSKYIKDLYAKFEFIWICYFAFKKISIEIEFTKQNYK